MISTHAPAGGATNTFLRDKQARPDFYSRPCGRGDRGEAALCCASWQISTHAPAGGATHVHGYTPRPVWISTHAPAGGATRFFCIAPTTALTFLLTPLREGRLGTNSIKLYRRRYFYSRPCGRGDRSGTSRFMKENSISTHAPAGGATLEERNHEMSLLFLLTPLREGRPALAPHPPASGRYFYSRPCGRGDLCIEAAHGVHGDFYSRPCGRGDAGRSRCRPEASYFYSRPCGRGDRGQHAHRDRSLHFYSRPCGRGDMNAPVVYVKKAISTHAPAGGATERRKK